MNSQEKKQEIQQLFRFIENCPSAYQTVQTIKEELKQHGFEELLEHQEWKLCAGKRYFVTRNASSLIAFSIPEQPKQVRGYHIVATHGDAPSFKLKPSFERNAQGNCVQWNVECYGGAIHSSWMDRPLSIAGRVLVAQPNGVKAYPVHVRRDVALIPNVAIHMDRRTNEGKPFQPQVDMLPLVGLQQKGQGLMEQLAEEIGVTPSEIVSHDLFLYVRDEGRVFGLHDEFLAAPRIDDLSCTYAAMQAFLQGAHAQTIPVLAVFDNEEIGSNSRQGAASGMLRDVLTRVDAVISCEEQAVGGLQRRLSSSCLLSADNAHALHPNHAEYADQQNAPNLNAGVVIKYSAEQRYATDAVSAAVFRRICDRAGVKTQSFANRSDIRGGSTLGHIVVSDLGCLTLDIGLPQLAMHSAYETAGADDMSDMIGACKAFYHTSLNVRADGEVDIDSEGLA